MEDIFTEKEKSFAKKVLHSKLFKNLIARNADRFQVLVDFFERYRIPYTLITLKGHRHILIRFNNLAYDKNYVCKTFIAHYDRCGNSFAANDNSAACVQLSFFAYNLKSKNYAHNVQIIFTDAEELHKKSIRTQGSFLLGLGLREINENRQGVIFVFDMCGRGDCLVFSQAGIFLREKVRTEKIKLFQEIARNVAKENGLPYMSLPTAFSDNAGLLASGNNAQLITVLPKKEATVFYDGLKALCKKMPAQNFYELIKKGVIEANKKTALDGIIPHTWKLMHSDGDTFESLNVEAFALMQRYFSALERLKIKAL